MTSNLNLFDFAMGGTIFALIYWLIPQTLFAAWTSFMAAVIIVALANRYFKKKEE
jgi:hypothetical protein